MQAERSWAKRGKEKVVDEETWVMPLEILTIDPQLSTSLPP